MHSKDTAPTGSGEADATRAGITHRKHAGKWLLYGPLRGFASSDVAVNLRDGRVVTVHHYGIDHSAPIAVVGGEKMVYVRPERQLLCYSCESRHYRSEVEITLREFPDYPIEIDSKDGTCDCRGLLHRALSRKRQREEQIAIEDFAQGGAEALAEAEEIAAAYREGLA